VLDRTFPVERIREAHEHLEARRAFGKVVVTF
jgi:NADPH:quinone reductase-like Zn-dependent oxidoreductase